MSRLTIQRWTSIVATLAIVIVLVAVLAKVVQADEDQDYRSFLAWEQRAELFEGQTLAISQEMEVCKNNGCLALYVGELFAVTMAERTDWWSDTVWPACMEPLSTEYLFYLDATAMLYASLYHTVSAETGTHVDVEAYVTSWFNYQLLEYQQSIEPAREACNVPS